MKKLYYKFILLIFVTSGIAGCKLDPPIYPANGTTTSNGGSGSNTNPGGGSNNPGGGDQGDVTGLPIDAASNIEVQINGTTYKFKQIPSFGVVLPGTKQAQDAGTPNGYIAMQAYGNTLIDAAVIIVNYSTAGTYDIESASMGNFTKGSDDKGRIKITKLTNNNIQGVFTVDLVDFNDQTKVYPNCPGSFNINN